MSRSITSGMQTELAAGSLMPVHLVQIGFSSLTLYLCSLTRDVSWNGQTWLGNGWLLPIQPINETSDSRAVGVEIPLIGVSETLLAIVLQNADQKQDAYVRLGALNDSGAVIADPITLFKGKVDTVEIVDSIEQPSVSIRCESILARLDRPQNFRFTSENQKALYPGDRGFEFVPALQDASFYWGKAERPKWLQRRRRASSR